jgi:hypothetical protein
MHALVAITEMSNMFVHKTAKCIAVVRFYATAALFFFLLSVLLFLSSTELTAHYFSPRLLAIVHTATLGWGTMIIFGAAYQLLPVIFQEELFSNRLALASYLLLLTGTLLLVWCFWQFDTGLLMVIAGSTIVTAALLYTINVCMTSIRSQHHSVYQYFLVSSAIWLILTTVAGLLLAINLTTNFIPRNHLDMLKLHAHAGIAGWFLQLICGVGAKLIPMFLLSKSKKNWLLYSALALQNLGLVLVLCHGYFRSIDSGIIPFATLIILGLVLWATYITDIYRHRLRKKVDTLMKQTLLSFTCIPLAIVTLVITFNSTAGKWTSLYGTLIFLGWITGIILGKTFKTLPFIIWNNKYKDIHGSAKIPLPKNLYSERLTNYQTYLFVIALAALSTGLLSELAWILQAATLLWIALAVLYCYNVATVIFHKKTIDYGNTI